MPLWLSMPFFHTSMVHLNCTLLLFPNLLFQCTLKCLFSKLSFLFICGFGITEKQKRAFSVQVSGGGEHVSGVIMYGAEGSLINTFQGLLGENYFLRTQRSFSKQEVFEEHSGNFKKTRTDVAGLTYPFHHSSCIQVSSNTMFTSVIHDKKHSKLLVS